MNGFSTSGSFIEEFDVQAAFKRTTCTSENKMFYYLCAWVVLMTMNPIFSDFVFSVMEC